MGMDTSTLRAPERVGQVPAWVQDAVFYQIFPDRFARSERVAKPNNLEAWDSAPTIHGFKGGDLLGVVEHLDHLQDLGVNAIYLCPVFRSTANHRYHTHDYYEIDPILGGNDAFATLLREVHGRGMRVVIDGVFNHASRGFFQFNHILENGEASPYIDWFTVYSWPLHPYGPAELPAGYACWWDNRELPKFNTNTWAVREFLWNVGAHWIESGVDGWRLDVPNEIDDDEFWREFRRRVKGANPDAYIVGEIWGDARRWLAGDQFDAVMNYIFTKACLGFFTGQSGLNHSVIQNTGLDPVAPLDAEAFAGTIDWVLSLYPWESTLVQLNLLDSHDTARFLTIANGDDSALRLAVLFAMTFPGAPCVYYGDEIGMGGTTIDDARRGFEWDQSGWNQDLLGYYRRAIALRHEHPVLRRGSYRRLAAGNGIYVFERRLDRERAIVALNVASEARTIDLSLGNGTRLIEPLVAWGDHRPDFAGSELHNWLVPSRSGVVVIASTGE
jgi:cyclomaltodextrinase